MSDTLLTIDWDEINDLLTQSVFEELDAPKTASANFSKSKNGMYKHDAFVFVTTSDYTRTHPLRLQFHIRLVLYFYPTEPT